MKKIKVLSLFDGMSCGQIALNRAGFEVVEYYASEIKPYAVATTKRNYPNTIQLGDVTKVTGLDVDGIDLLIGGSPCQDFSQANSSREGLNGPKSRLFYHFLRVLSEVKPRYFFLENVKMKQESEALITKLLGVEPIEINSALVSAQNRKRLYWTNIPNVTQPEERGILLKDILEKGYTDKQKSRCLLESDSRPLSTPVKMFHRYYSSGFTTLIFKSKEHFENCVKHYNSKFKGLPASEIDGADCGVYDGVRYLSASERAILQTVPAGYLKGLTENQASCLLGDGWTVDVIAHIFKNIEI